MAPLLDNFGEDHVLQLGQALWSREYCTGCTAQLACVASPQCIAQLRPQLKRYLQFYHGVISDHTTPVFQTHEDIFAGLRKLRDNPSIKRSEFYGQIASPGARHSDQDSQKATALIVNVLLMIDCSALHHSSDRLERGDYRVYWKDDVAFDQYLKDLFPIQIHLTRDMIQDMKSELRATVLQKRLKINFIPAHDIRNHLRFNRRRNELEIFHYAAFIKEHLRATKGSPSRSSTPESVLFPFPRQLLLEVLGSIQGVLFPLSDPKSKRLLHSLVKYADFDPETTRLDFSNFGRPGEECIAYMYFADRLAELYNESINPRPSGWLEKHMERKSGARYMMMATLIGVLFAVFLGVFSLGVGSYQTWIAYQAWKHPVAPSSL